MKTIARKTLALLLLVLLTPPLATMASPEPGRKEHPVRRETKAYMAQNVLPALRQQRQKLEPQLTPADQAQLASYRTQLRELRQRGHALRQSFRPTPAAPPQAAEPAHPHAALSEAQQQQLQQLRTEARTVMQNVTVLAQKYESTIAQLTREMQPQRQKWAADLRAIAAKNATLGRPQHPGPHGSRPHSGGASRLLRPAAFLLLDPNAATPPAKADLGGSRLYPNPATATSTLAYTVRKAGPVTVELLDSRGTALRTVAQESQQEKGAYTLPVNLADLPAGTYYYKITTRAGAETQRFVKE